MSGVNEVNTCPFCKHGTLIWQNQEIAFRQKTGRKYVFCRVTVPLGVCASCGSKSFTDVADFMMEEAVHRECELANVSRAAHSSQMRSLRSCNDRFDEFMPGKPVAFGNSRWSKRENG
jgi:hypothetical protein